MRRVYWLCLFLGLVSVVSCRPALQWQVHSFANGMLQVEFPGEVHTRTREVMIASVEQTLHLANAQVDQMQFTLTWLVFEPDLSKAQRQAISQTTVDHLFRSLGQVPPHVNADDFAAAFVSASTGVPLWVQVRIVEQQDVLVRLLATGPSEKLSQSVGSMFIESFAPR